MTEKSKIIGSYGTLKRGHYNHERFGEQKFLGEYKIHGAMQLVFGDSGYPFLFMDAGTTHDEDEHVLEVFEVDLDNYESIKAMEIGAGYYEEVLDSPFGEMSVFLANSDLLDPEKPFIKSFGASQIIFCK